MKRILTIFFLFLMACSESTVEPDLSRVGFDYFPLQVGRYITYNVESIDYDVLGTIDTALYEMKVEVVDSFENQAGETSYILYRSTRSNESDPWEFQSAWSAYATSNLAVLIEENVPYLKLTFPLEKDKTWDGNKLNTQEADDYILDEIDESYITPLGDSIPNVSRVVQSDNQDIIIQQDKRIEMYARGIGMVYKESLLYNYCAETSCIGLEQVESGYYYKQEMLTHGKN